MNSARNPWSPCHGALLAKTPVYVVIRQVTLTGECARAELLEDIRG
jgi:hypothetical protein